MILQYALLIGLVLFSILAVLAKDLIKSAIALAAGSLLLGIVFFRMGAPYAGVFEISVVAGLITVLFILTIALTKAEGEVAESKAALWAFPVFFVLFIIIDALVMKGLMNKVPALPGPASSSRSPMRSSAEAARSSIARPTTSQSTRRSSGVLRTSPLSDIAT